MNQLYTRIKVDTECGMLQQPSLSSLGFLTALTYMRETRLFDVPKGTSVLRPVKITAYSGLEMTQLDSWIGKTLDRGDRGIGLMAK